MIQKKICMVGAFGVGKTSLVARFVHSIFSEKYLTTVGVKIDKKLLHIKGEDVTLVLWDLAGKDAITQVKPEHLRGSAGYLLVADGTRGDTLPAALELESIADRVTDDAQFSLLINKADLQDKWEIKTHEVDSLRKQGWPVHLTSAKTGEGVEAAFLELATRILRKEYGGEQSNASAG